MTPIFAIFCGMLAVSWLLPAAAQERNQRPHPADPAAAVPALRHSSAFEGYRPLGNDKAAEWREANDEVAHAGGHIGILRGAPAGQGGDHASHRPGASK